MIGSRETFRPTPALGAENMVTHQIAAPLHTHWRRATCAEVGCPNYLNGWTVNTVGLPPDVVDQARKSGRGFREVDGDGGPVLVFEAGQPCFAAVTHQIRIDRPEVFSVRDGDWRGNPRDTEPLVFSGADAFADHMHTHLDKFEQ